MSDFMAFAHRCFAVHEDMEFHKKPHAAFARAAFFDVHDAWDFSGNGANFLDQIFWEVSVQNIVEGSFRDQGTIDDDDRAGEQRGVVVGCLPTRSANQRNGDADPCRG